MTIQTEGHVYWRFDCVYYVKLWMFVISFDVNTNTDWPFCISSLSVTDEDTVKRYYAKFEEKFFQTCEKELSKINTFYSGI